MSKQASSATLADVARMAVEQVLLQRMANFGYSDAVASSFSLWHIPYSGKLSREKTSANWRFVATCICEGSL